MKKLFGLALLGSLIMAGTANAALYRVDFSGTVGDGTYDGYFTYDTAGLNLNGSNAVDLTIGGADDLPGSGFETSLIFNYSFTGGSGNFTDANAGVGGLGFSSGELNSWFVGADANGIRQVTYGDPLATQDDLGLCSDCIDHAGWLFLVGDGRHALSFPTWEVAEISAVPLPGAVWAFGAGLLGLLGLKRRRKMKMLQTATA